jgi:hypothetical protein
MSEQLIANLANAFKPVPLPAGSPFYVALKAGESGCRCL